MSWIDVAILAFAVLVGLFGVWKGVKKGFVSLGAFLISFLLAFFLANVIAEALLGIESVRLFVLGNADGSGWSLASWIAGGIPADATGETFIDSHFFKPMFDVVTASNSDIPVQTGVALYGAYVMFAAICSVGIFIVARFLLMIVTAIIKSYILTKPGSMGRLFGFLLGVVRGALWALAVTFVFSCFGGYTNVAGINAIEKEYESNAVICNYFNEAAYGLRNKLFLPDKETYGRIVEMVYKKETPIEPEKEELSGERLKLFVNVSNLNYDNQPWSIDENRKRVFDAENAQERKASEFTATGFDSVTEKVLGYTKKLAETIEDTTKLTDITTESFTSLNDLVDPLSSTKTVDFYINQLWQQLRTYEQHFKVRDEDVESSVLDSTLAGDYNAIKITLNSIKEAFAPFANASAEGIDAFPDLDLPPQKTASDPVVTEPPQENEQQPEGGEQTPNENEQQPEGGEQTPNGDEQTPEE